MEEKEFNLLREPWIRVLMPNYTVKEVSLTDALLHAHEYLDLAGELPTQDVAILRLLLAVLQTVFSRVDEFGNSASICGPNNATEIRHKTEMALNRWEALWNLRQFPEKPVRDYLKKWEDRFWLFDPERPFWQVPDASIGTEYFTSKLNGEILESGNKTRIFSSFSGPEKDEMSYAQAARWLLHVNGFDDTSGKPKGKNLPSPGAGWLGKLGLITAQGENLFQTLLLNLVFLKDGESLWEDQKPCWERTEVRKSERTEIPQPNNAAELLTLQSRRVLLHRQDGKVTGYSLLGGDFIAKENAFCEQMTVWRKISAKKNMPDFYQPKRHDPNKQFWREFPAVFCYEQSDRPPGIVRWITQLQKYHKLGREAMIRFQIAAVVYGDKDFFVTDSFSDSLAFHAQLLGELGITWRKWIADEVNHCEELSKLVSRLAKDLAIAAGDMTDRQRRGAQEAFYFQIDQPFRDWIYAIDPTWGGEAKSLHVSAWQEHAKQIARKLGARMVAEVGTVALIGRNANPTAGNGKKQNATKKHYSAAEAYRDFLIGMKTIFKA